MTLVLGLDPGLRSGFAWATYSDTEPLQILETGAISGGCEGFIDWWRHPDTEVPDEVVCELFIIDGTITGSWSARIEGALMALYSGPITWQYRRDKDALLSGEAERRAWFRRRGLRFRSSHALDSASHLAVAFKRRRHMPTLRNWWPNPSESAPAP